MKLTGNSTEEKAWNYLKSVIGNEYGAAALMGNLDAESGLKTNNMENAYQKKLGFTDETYTAAVDNGTYTNFVKDAVGYGLAQWTYWSRKQGLLDKVKAKGVSISDLETQLEYLVYELKTKYKSVYNALVGATEILAASNVVLKDFENPKNQGDSVKKYRASLGQAIYDKYASGANTTVKEENKNSPTANTTGYDKSKVAYAKSKNNSLTGKYTVTATSLNFRYVPGKITSDNIICEISKDETVQCYGYYTTVDGTKWLYVVYKGMTGFCSMKYLKK